MVYLTGQNGANKRSSLLGFPEEYGILKHTLWLQNMDIYGLKGSEKIIFGA